MNRCVIRLMFQRGTLSRVCWWLLAAVVILSMWSWEPAYAHHGEERLTGEGQVIRLTTIVGDGKVELKWDLADRYYMYLSRIWTDTAGVSLREPRISSTNTLNLGATSVYEGRIIASVPYKIRDDRIRSFDLHVEYQACSYSGTCFKRRPRHVLIDLAQGSSDSMSAMESLTDQ